MSLVEDALAAHTAAAAAEGVFVSLVPRAAVVEAAEAVEARVAAGETLPLAGLTFAVKDNVDVAGMASTSNVPGYGRVAEASAPAVEKALAAGAILIGRNTMDQFATGLNGTRAFAPLCRNAIDPDLIPGGSSSGSAVAVARGVVDFALGSDTGGSGRVPAAANGIVGLKPTPGIVSGRGMVYCNRSFDVIPVFAPTVAAAFRVFDAIRGPDPLDPFAYTGPTEAEAPDGAPLAVLAPRDLDFFGAAPAEAAYRANIERLAATGHSFGEIDFAPFREAGRLVFESALVAERLVDYGDFIEAHPDAVAEPVRRAIDAGRGYTARDAFEAIYRLAELKRVAAGMLAPYAALVVPTVPRLFTVAEMQAEPMARNTVMGTYTYFANPLGLSAIAVPGVRCANGWPSSLSFIGRPGAEAVLRHLAGDFEAGDQAGRPERGHAQGARPVSR